MKASLVIISLLGLMTGCKAFRAIDSANAIPEKLDATYSQIVSTNSQIKKTNQGIDETNESVRLQKLILSKNDMLDDKNTKDLEPVALGMIAGAKKFGEAATTQEILEYTYVLLRQIEDQRPDDSLKGPDGKFPKDIIETYDHKKLVDLNQILTIAGFCPQDKVDQIIRDQINNEDGGGEYRDEAYIFLMGRVMFLGTYLQEVYLAKEISTVEKMRQAITRLGYIDSILKLPYNNEIKLEVNTFLGRDQIVAVLVQPDGTMDDSWNAPRLWKKMSKRIDQDLTNGKVATGSVANPTKIQSDIADLKATVQSYIDSWNK